MPNGVFTFSFIPTIIKCLPGTGSTWRVTVPVLIGLKGFRKGDSYGKAWSSAVCRERCSLRVCLSRHGGWEDRAGLPVGGHDIGRTAQHRAGQATWEGKLRNEQRTPRASEIETGLPLLAVEGCQLVSTKRWHNWVLFLKGLHFLQDRKGRWGTSLGDTEVAAQRGPALGL